jgi:hypothetical protein
MKELRMYTLALYQLSGIQAGIQAGHSWVEYGQQCKDKKLHKEWAKKHKTVMVMNGGSTIIMGEHMDNLELMGVDYVGFNEPDLDGIVSAVSFIVSSRVFDRSYTWLKAIEEGEPFTTEEASLREYLLKLRFHG